jgi:di/tricarboxylate transporter
MQGIDIYVMAFAIMLAASAVYTTPFGDNINLMTSGVGNFSVWEFVRFGVGVQVSCLGGRSVACLIRLRFLFSKDWNMALTAAAGWHFYGG